MSATLVSIVTLDASALLLGPELPALSTTEPDASRKTTVPVVPTTVHPTVIVMVVPDDEEGVNEEQVAVPEAWLKSAEVSPLTLSENSNV